MRRPAPGVTAARSTPRRFCVARLGDLGLGRRGPGRMARVATVTLVRGEGRVARPGVDAGGQELEYDRLVVATGSSPVTPPELEGTEVWHTGDATSSHEVPAGLVVVGGGVAGCELAQLYRRLGSEVTIVQRNIRLIPRLDQPAHHRRQAIDQHGERPLAEAAQHRCGRRRPRRAHGPQGERRGPRPRAARRDDHEPRGRDGRTPARRRKRLGDRRLHHASAVHPPRQVPGANRGARHRRANDEGGLPRDPGGRLHRSADRLRRHDGSRRARRRPLECREHLARVDLRKAQAARLRQGRGRPEGGVLVGAVAVGPGSGSGASS